jgi:hypothetical protein
MKMEIYGFKASVYKAGDFFVGEIPELHVHDQAKSLRELEEDLKDTAVSFSLERKKKGSEALRKQFARI